MKTIGKTLSLAAIGVSLIAGSTFFTSSAEAACVIGVRSNDVLNMRSYASTRAAIVGVLRPRACGVTIRKRSGNWGLIRHRGRQGWVNLRYLGEGDEGDGGDSPSWTQACVVGVAGNDVLNIRSRPSGSSRIKGIVPPGSCRMRVYERGSRWSRISYRGVFGWVSNRFVREL